MKRILLTVLLLAAGVFPLFASADYYIKNYDVKIEVGNDAVHHVTETIDVYFERAHHGLVREIPHDYSDYNGTTAKIENLKCSEDFRTDKDNGYLIMRIGSESRTVTGDVQYVISYDYDLGADYNDGYDELYLNIIGTDWECIIENASFSVIIPYVPDSGYENFEAFYNGLKRNIHFSAGGYGSKASDFSVWISKAGEDAAVISGSEIKLYAYEGITMRIDLPEAWYHGAREIWDFRDEMEVIHPILCIVLLVIAVFLWHKYGRDNVPIIVAKLEAPKGMPPLLVGYVSDLSVDDKDIVSMLFYWADEGLIRIDEKGGEKYEFTKLKEIRDYAIESGKNILNVEMDLFDGFFNSCDVGGKVTFKTLEKNQFYKVIEKVRTSTQKYFTGERALRDRRSDSVSAAVSLLSFLPLLSGTLRIGFYENFPTVVILHFFLSLILFFVNIMNAGSLMRTWNLRSSNIMPCILRLIPPVIGVFLLMRTERFLYGTAALLPNIFAVGASTALAFFASITEKRSKYGDEVLEGILGYKEFIEKVEIEKLKMMIEQYPNFYYHVLSYAIVLGLENKWARKFENLPLEQPEWLGGASVIDALYLSRLSSRMMGAVKASVPKSSISGSAGSHVGGGGFGSGGFSGGGFGGGGGHAW
ncbi:MAG: DUF2207 domain-containing protein [Spirochaetales bacterium]